MADYAILKSAIQDVIKQNGNNEITGEILQQSLFAMVNSLGAGYQFAGIAKLTPTQTDPGTPDQNVFYIAAESGSYTNFPISGGYLQVAENEVAIFKYNGQWSKETTGAATAAKVNQLGQEVTELDQKSVDSGYSSSDRVGLLFSDQYGNVIAEFVGGHIKTRFFDSENIPLPVDFSYSKDFYITDNSGNAVLKIAAGHIQTKHFDSKNLSPYRTFSVIGDSWSAMKGYVQPDTNVVWYPSTEPTAQGYGSGNDVLQSSQMWWHIVANQLKMRLVKCNAYSGSRIANSASTTTSFLGRMNDIGESPQLSLVMGTRNDDGHTDLGEYKYSDWTAEDLTTYRPALAKLLTDLQDQNIGAAILFVSNSGNADKKASAAEICSHLHIPLLQLNLLSAHFTGGHPNTTGMTVIASAVVNSIFEL